MKIEVNKMFNGISDKQTLKSLVQVEFRARRKPLFKGLQGVGV